MLKKYCKMDKFNVRVAAIIFNSDMTKIFMQKQDGKDYYMFPGGRLEMHEEAKDAIERELNEELGINNESLNLKFISENFIKFSNKKYHEIGFYFILKIDEKKYHYDLDIDYNSKDEKHDGKSIFRWIEIKDLEKYIIMPNCMKKEILNLDKNLNDNSVKHLVYREYEQI